MPCMGRKVGNSHAFASRDSRGWRIETRRRVQCELTMPEYGLPMDDAELDRIDMCHAKYYALLNKKRYLAPISDPQRILDLGCGTGELHPPQRSMCPPLTVQVSGPSTSRKSTRVRRS